MQPGGDNGASNEGNRRITPRTIIEFRLLLRAAHLRTVRRIASLVAWSPNYARNSQNRFLNAYVNAIPLLRFDCGHWYRLWKVIIVIQLLNEIIIEK